MWVERLSVAFFVISGASIFFLLFRVGYWHYRFPEYLRRHHPEKYRELLGGWEGPEYFYSTGEMSSFMWNSEDDLGDPMVAFLRSQVRRSLRQLMIVGPVVMLCWFAFAMAAYLLR